MVNTTDEWIMSRTGIRERHIVGPNDSTTSLAAAAGREALARAGRTASEIDLIVVGTATPDDFLVSQACLVQAELGGNAGAFDVGAACAGFVTAFSVGSQFINSGVYKRALVIGVDTLTRYVDYTDRSTCVLFGDGAGAVVIEATDEPRGLLSTVLGADGAGHKHLYVPGWGGLVPESADLFPEYRPYLQMNGKEVFRFAVQVMGDAAVEAVEKWGSPSTTSPCLSRTRPTSASSMPPLAASTCLVSGSGSTSTAMAIRLRRPYPSPSARRRSLARSKKA